MVCSRLEAQNAGVGLGGPFLPRMEQHLPRLPRPSNRLPFEFVAVTHFHRLMFCKPGICRHGISSWEGGRSTIRPVKSHCNLARLRRSQADLDRLTDAERYVCIRTDPQTSHTERHTSRLAE